MGILMLHALVMALGEAENDEGGQGLMALILFGVFIALLLLGVPVAFAICSAAATTMFAGFGTAK